jgi:hypothetical protein
VVLRLAGQYSMSLTTVKQLQYAAVACFVAVSLGGIEKLKMTWIAAKRPRLKCQSVPNIRTLLPILCCQSNVRLWSCSGRSSKLLERGLRPKLRRWTISCENFRSTLKRRKRARWHSQYVLKPLRYTEPSGVKLGKTGAVREGEQGGGRRAGESARATARGGMARPSVARLLTRLGQAMARATAHQGRGGIDLKLDAAEQAQSG